MTESSNILQAVAMINCSLCVLAVIVSLNKLFVSAGFISHIFKAATNVDIILEYFDKIKPI